MEIPDPIAVLRDALRARDLRRLVLSYLGVRIGEFGVWIALAAEAYRLGGVGEATAVMVAQLAPAALFAPAVGTLAARFGPVRILTVGDATQVVGMTAAAVAFAVMPAAGGPVRFVAYAGAILAATAITVVRPCQACVVPAAVQQPEQLTAANVAFGWADGAGVLVGPALAAALMGAVGAWAVFAVLAVVVLGSTVLVARVVEPPARIRDESPPTPREVATVVREIARRPAVRPLAVVLATGALVAGALDLTYVVVSVELLGLGESAAGWLNAAFGAGMAAGGVSAVLLIGRRRLAPPLLGGLCLLGVSVLGMALTERWVVSVAVLVAAGVGAAVGEIGARSLLQRVAGIELLGHAFAAVEGVQMAMLAAGALYVSALVAVGGPVAAPIGVGALVLVVAGVSARRILDTDSHADAPLVEMTQLRHVPALAALGAPELETLARSARRLEVAPGTVLCHQGEDGEEFFVVVGGEVAVAVDGDVRATLGPGSGFGEIALLRECPRTATVSATAPTSLLGVGRDAYLTAVTGDPLAASLAVAGMAVHTGRSG